MTWYNNNNNNKEHFFFKFENKIFSVFVMKNLWKKIYETYQIYDIFIIQTKDHFF